MFGKTHSTKPAEVEKKWLLIDGAGLVVGRLASIVAMRLHGKHKPSFTPHVDDGDNVIVVNAEKVVFTGKKRDEKMYYHYTGYIGGIKEKSAKSLLDGRYPERVVEKAVERMLPRGPLGRKQLGNLRVYKGPDHPHAAQQPVALDVQRLDKHGRAYATGKRKNAVARVWIKPGRGLATVNGKPLDQYFARPVLRMILSQPLVVANRITQYDLTVRVAERLRLVLPDAVAKVEVTHQLPFAGEVHV